MASTPASWPRGWRRTGLALLTEGLQFFALGLGHVMKGTPEMGNPVYEYEYVDQYMKLSALGLLWLDLKIIGRGIKVILRRKGL